jgi:hypothetical protein
MRETECTISGRGAARTASHVGDLRLGSDVKCMQICARAATVSGMAATAELPVTDCAPYRSD